MAKKPTRKNTGGQFDFKRLAFILIVLLIIWLISEYYPQLIEDTDEQGPAQTEQTTPDTTPPATENTTGGTTTPQPTVTTVNAPSNVGKNQIVEHQSYKLSYNEEHEQADWVFYLLTQAMVNGDEGRSDDFREDPQVTLKSATPQDYTNSGYDRGHLCPSADMKMDNTAQSETFYMSNMSPQAPAFNRGIWKKLEEQTRRWVGVHDSIYIATGPVLKKGLKTIGHANKVSVPEHYYKILYTPSDGGHIIAFMLPNNGCQGKKYTDFIVSVDEVEKATGIDFFPLIPNEEVLESMKTSTTWWN